MAAQKSVNNEAKDGGVFEKSPGEEVVEVSRERQTGRFQGPRWVTWMKTAQERFKGGGPVYTRS